MTERIPPGFVTVTNLIHDDGLYTVMLDRVRQNDALVSAMWSDAESRPEELDIAGTYWTVAVAEAGIAAWCAARVIDGGSLLKCHSNYEVREFRGRGLYEAVYRYRHHTLIQKFGLPAVTYLFRQPIALHAADGWYETRLTGPGEIAGHQWWELRRPAAASG